MSDPAALSDAPVEQQQDPVTMGRGQYYSGVLKNLGPSFVENLAGTAHALAPWNWGETASNIGEVAKGAYSKAKDIIAPETTSSFNEGMEKANQRIKDQAVLNAVVKPFSSWENVQRTMYNDPFSVLSVAAIPFTEGGSMLGNASKIGKVARLAGTVMDPTKTVVQGVSGISNLGRKAAQTAASAATGEPYSAFETAYQAGKTAGQPGRDARTVFNAYATGKTQIPVTDWAGHELEPYAVAGEQIRPLIANGTVQRMIEGGGGLTNLGIAGYHLMNGNPGRAAFHLAGIPAQMALQSPRFMGNAAYYAGRAVGSPVASAVSTATKVASPFEQAMNTAYTDVRKNEAAQQPADQPQRAVQPLADAPSEEQQKPKATLPDYFKAQDLAIAHGTKIDEELAGMGVEPLPRASGGRTNDSAISKANDLISMVDKIKKQQNKATEPLLNLDDNTVAKALAIANRGI